MYSKYSEMEEHHGLQMAKVNGASHQVKNNQDSWIQNAGAFQASETLKKSGVFAFISEKKGSMKKVV